MSEAVLFAYQRTYSYIALGAAAYALTLWLVTRAFISVNEESEEAVLRTTAKGARLALRVAVVAATFIFIRFEFSAPVWHSAAMDIVQKFSERVGIGYGDSALPNVIVEVLIPGTLLFLLGAKPIELGLTSWRKGARYAFLGALVLPVIFIGMWWTKGHASIGLLALLLVRNLLSNGFSEEFLTRGMALSHLRAFFSKDWAVVLQAVIFGLWHLDSGTIAEAHGHWFVGAANVIALNSPVGYVLALVALRARSIVLPALIHMTLDTMKDLVM